MSIGLRTGKQVQTYNKKYRKVISKKVFTYLYGKKKKYTEKRNMVVHIIKLMTLSSKLTL